MKGIDQIVAAIRTAVAALVGYALTYLATRGIEIDGFFVEVMQVVLFLGITGLYNVAVNWLQAKFGKAWGFLLLIPKLPSYTVEEAREEVRDPAPDAP